MDRICQLFRSPPGLCQIPINELCGSSYRNLSVLFYLRLQNVERRLVFFHPRPDNSGLVYGYGKQETDDKARGHCSDSMGEKAVGHGRIQQQRAYAAMQKPRIPLIYPAAGKCSLDSFIFPQGKSEPQSRRVSMAATDASRVFFLSGSFQNLLVWICHKRIVRDSPRFRKSS